MNFSPNLTFSDDILREGEAAESYNAAPSQNISLQSQFSELVDASIFDQAFVENDRNDLDNTLTDENFDLPETQNILDYSTDNQSSQVETVVQTIDDVDISKAAPKEETAAGIVANSSSSVLMMSDEPSRVSTFRHFSSTNHVSFGVKFEKCLDTAQKDNLERILKTKMKFVFLQ
uniref:Uncharacterized protein n=1 Tax=Panagrolaimus superbus TaxID=310955 RepID=A0A914YAP9_9BILA